mmetsp:Transcript_17931/g.26861  ORF Transcript_17931/g.26861 Transcript_17931/m.26861 type:complete len:90 (+) Transcript_17931:423-692(+)
MMTVVGLIWRCDEMSGGVDMAIQSSMMKLKVVIKFLYKYLRKNGEIVAAGAPTQISKSKGKNGGFLQKETKNGRENSFVLLGFFIEKSC